jgi:malate synthase
MAAFIPSRKDPEINKVALAKVREDKERESQDGFDGTWVAHPDLVPTAKDEFDKILGDKLNQKNRLREDVTVTANDLLNFNIADGRITEEGLRLNINVGIQYIESWLRGTGAAAIYNLMEDTATAEISRAQIWQWIYQPKAKLADGREITTNLYGEFVAQELQKIKEMWGDELYAKGKFELASDILTQLVTEDDFTDFLTLMAYKELD